MGVKCERSFKLGPVIPVTVMDDDGFLVFVGSFLSFFLFFLLLLFFFFCSFDKYRWVRKKMLMIDFFPRMFIPRSVNSFLLLNTIFVWSVYVCVIPRQQDWWLYNN